MFIIIASLNEVMKVEVSSLIKMSKGQSAMEYLMTYGWALLVIVIVIAVLMYIRPFSAPESCIFQSAGFSCEGVRILGDDVATTGGITNSVLASVVNGQQKSITNVEVVCVRGSSLPSTIAWKQLVPLGDYVSHGEEIGLISTGAPCYDSDGLASTISAGEDFAGRLYVKFNYRDEAATVPQKVVVATVTGQAQ